MGGLERREGGRRRGEEGVAAAAAHNQPGLQKRPTHRVCNINVLEECQIEIEIV